MVTTALPSAAQDIGGVDLIAVTVGATTVAVAMTFPVAGAVIDREGVGRVVRDRLLALCRRQRARRAGAVDAGRRRVAGHPGPRRRVHVRRPARPLRRLAPRRAAAAGVRDQRRDVGRLGADRAALGAVLTATVGWRWVFWINLPLIAVVAWSAARALRVVRPVRRPVNEARFNIAGPVLLGLVVAVLLALTKHWLPPLVLAPLALLPAGGLLLPRAADGRSRSSRTPPTRSPPTSPPSGPAWRSSAPRPTCRSSSRSGSTTASAWSASRFFSARSDGRPGR